MIICKGNIKSFDIPKNLILAIGNFEGIHLGHQKVINSCIEIAQDNGFIPAILTFDPHPNSVVDSKNNKKPIYSHTQKLEILKTFSISHLFILDFDINLMKLNPDDFIHDILVERFKVKAVVTGQNFYFGYKKLGNATILSNVAKKYSFSYYAIEKYTENGIEVSSSKIRELLSLGMLETSNNLLGRRYAIEGKIIYGEKLAETLGFKTANILLNEKCSYPMKGVYLVRITLSDEKRKLYGVANIGVRPTTSNESKLLLEVHIFNFNKDIYGKNAKVEFLHLIRPERNFKNIECLKTQIQKDVKDAQYVNSFPLLR